MSDEIKESEGGKRFALGTAVARILKNLNDSITKKVGTKLLIAEKAFINTLITRETRAGVLRSEDAKIAKLSSSSVNITGKLSTSKIDDIDKVFQTLDGASAEGLTEAQLNEIYSIINGKKV